MNPRVETRGYSLPSLRDSIHLRRDNVSPFEPDGQPRGAAPTRGSGTLRYKKPHAKLTPGNTTIFVSLCLGVKYDAVGNRLTQRHQDTKEDHSGRAANCLVAQARVVPVGRLLPGFLALGVRIPVSYAVRIMFSMEAAVQGRLLERLPRDRMLNTERHMTASR